MIKYISYSFIHLYQMQILTANKIITSISYLIFLKTKYEE